VRLHEGDENQNSQTAKQPNSLEVEERGDLEVCVVVSQTISEQGAGTSVHTEDKTRTQHGHSPLLLYHYLPTTGIYLYGVKSKSELSLSVCVRVVLNTQQTNTQTNKRTTYQTNRQKHS
jgi:hypothetical protein